MNVVDEFTREALAINADATVAVLERLAAERGAPANVRADNGPELTAVVLATGAGRAPPNPCAESFNARLRDELLNVEVFTSLTEAQVLTADWREDYNAKHPHSALGVMSPARSAASWQRIGDTNGSLNPGLSHGDR